MSEDFVPAAFSVPTTFSGSGFRMEPLGPQHNARDHVAWMSSIEHIRTAPAFAEASWPRAMSLEQNLADLEGHARDFEKRTGFTYAILDSDEVIGCVYIYPSQAPDHDADMKWWVTESRSEMETVVGPALATWLDTEWPFENRSGM
jgi:hypothetical protein